MVRFNEGSRAGYIRRIDYPADWPVADVEVSWIVDRCFAPVHATGAVHRAPFLPAGPDRRGHRARRAISWYDRTWADRAHNALGRHQDRGASAMGPGPHTPTRPLWLGMRESAWKIGTWS